MGGGVKIVVLHNIYLQQKNQIFLTYSVNVHGVTAHISFYFIDFRFCFIPIQSQENIQWIEMLIPKRNICIYTMNGNAHTKKEIFVFTKWIEMLIPKKIFVFTIMFQQQPLLVFLTSLNSFISNILVKGMFIHALSIHKIYFPIL